MVAEAKRLGADEDLIALPCEYVGFRHATGCCHQEMEAEWGRKGAGFELGGIVRSGEKTDGTSQGGVPKIRANPLGPDVETKSFDCMDPRS